MIEELTVANIGVIINGTAGTTYWGPRNQRLWVSFYTVRGKPLSAEAEVIGPRTNVPNVTIVRRDGVFSVQMLKL
jgi:hypothetical protein